MWTLNILPNNKKNLDQKDRTQRYKNNEVKSNTVKTNEATTNDVQNDKDIYSEYTDNEMRNKYNNNHKLKENISIQVINLLGKFDFVKSYKIRSNIDINKRHFVF